MWGRAFSFPRRHEVPISPACSKSSNIAGITFQNSANSMNFEIVDLLLSALIYDLMAIKPMVWGLEPDPPWLMKVYHDPLGVSILIYSPGWFDHSTNSLFSQGTGQQLPEETCACQLTPPWAQQLFFPAGKIGIVSKHLPSWNTRSNIKSLLCQASLVFSNLSFSLLHVFPLSHKTGKLNPEIRFTPGKMGCGSKCEV